MNDLSPPIQLLPLGLTDWKFVGGGVGDEEGRGGGFQEQCEVILRLTCRIITTTYVSILALYHV